MLTTVEPTPSGRYTREIRQRIVRDFAARHGGRFDPKLFEAEVRGEGPAHEAYQWFEWDDDAAAYQYRLYQAREFAVGLKIVFTREELGRNKTITIVQRDAPMLLSPLDGRAHGGGYYLLDPDNAEHLSELCLQALTQLRTWRARYSFAIAEAGQTKAVDKVLAALEAAASDEAA